MRKMEVDSEDFARKAVHSSIANPNANASSAKEIKRDPIASLDLGELQQE